jgi:hypothetical protein
MTLEKKGLLVLCSVKIILRTNISTVGMGHLYISSIVRR